MANAEKQQIKALYMWWNGWVFSFEKDPKLKYTVSDNEESSGMDEALECLDDVDEEVPTGDQQEENDLIATFDSLAMSMAVHQQSNLSSSGSSGVPRPEIVLSLTPGPSHMHSDDQQDILNTDNSQPRDEETSRKGKGKGKAVDITEEVMEVEQTIAGGRQRRGRPKKTAI
jgi:hypothetical protein